MMRSRQPRPRTATKHAPRPLGLEPLECRTVPTVFAPSQIRQAYGFDAIQGDGSGQTIAIVDAYDHPNIAADLAAFDAAFGLPDPPSFVKATPQGTPPVDSGWAMEIALDVEWAHAIAPGANILLVEAKSSSLIDLLGAVQYAAAQPGVSVVSMSWGAGEFQSETYYDSYFTTPAGHPGVTFVASSGDYGAPPSWPAISPNVLSVGGTSLTLNADNSYNSETGWSGSGGGTSRYESKPAYQTDVNTGAKKRSNPDVAYNADPSTGVYVYDTTNGGWLAVGGTSAGAPQWAALVALADQGRAAAGQTPLDGPSQTLYALYKGAAASWPTYYHDITSGYNGTSAKAGYDTVTGLGTPLASQVVSALVSWTGTGNTGSLGGGPTSPPPPPSGGGGGKGHPHITAASVSSPVAATELASATEPAAATTPPVVGVTPAPATPPAPADASPTTVVVVASTPAAPPAVSYLAPLPAGDFTPAPPAPVSAPAVGFTPPVAFAPPAETAPAVGDDDVTLADVRVPAPDVWAAEGGVLVGIELDA